MISIFWRSANRPFQSHRGLRQTAAAGTAVLTMGLLLFSGAAASASPKLASQAVRVATASSSCGSLTVMTERPRLPAVQDYEKAHPCVKVTTTLFGYTGSTLQTKIGLFNREGSGWPELMWDPGTPDAGWLIRPPTTMPPCSITASSRSQSQPVGL